MLVDGEVLNVLRWSVAGGATAARPVRRAAPHRVSRPAGAGRHQDRVPHDRVHAGAPARWRVRRLAHDRGARRAVRARGRSRRAVRVRVLPGRRQRSRTSSGCTIARTRASSRPPTASSRELLDVLPASTPRCSSRPITGRCTSKPSRGSRFPTSSRSITTMAGDGRFRYLYARKGANRELLEPRRERGRRPRRGCGRARSCSSSALLGAGATGTIPGRIGDVDARRARRRSRSSIPRCPTKRTLRSGHGSLTADEMCVPARGARAGSS